MIFGNQIESFSIESSLEPSLLPGQTNKCISYHDFEYISCKMCCAIRTNVMTMKLPDEIDNVPIHLKAV